ncbi:hypothetical protein FALCPG4_018548 [Fusarium falciforme]
MKILFLCTTHNSLSQQLFLALRQTHSVTIEYAVSDSAMIEAAALAQPDLIICPFLTARVPDEVHTNYLTLITGSLWATTVRSRTPVNSSNDGSGARQAAPTGGVTVLQATAEFDAGPIWAFEQFELDIDAPGVTKSTLYRGPVTRAAIKATLAALDRIMMAARWPTPYDTYTPPPPAGLERNQLSAMLHQGLPMLPSYSLTDAISIACGSGISPKLLAEPSYSVASVTQHLPFLGGATHRRPLLKASHRDFNIGSDNARAISRRIRSADSQPGCLTKLFGGISLYVYGGTIEEGPGLAEGVPAGRIIACKDGAVCIATCDALGIWISHVRRVKRKVDPMLWPKVPAVSGLRALGLLDDATLTMTLKSHLTTDWTKARYSTHQEIWVDFAAYSYPNARRVAFVYFEFYNGAMSTDQCSRLIEALEFVSSTHTDGNPLNAVVLMGGSSYFSNGIALNVVEASDDPAAESWRNINRIDDVIHVLLDGFPRRNIMTVAAIRGNCAAGGVAMATACDVVIAGSETVLNPAYRALGLHGSEYHSLSYLGRCGAAGSKHLLRAMLPLSPYEARDMGLVDHTLPGWGGLARYQNSEPHHGYGLQPQLPLCPGQLEGRPRCQPSRPRGRPN